MSAKSAPLPPMRPRRRKRGMRTGNERTIWRKRICRKKIFQKKLSFQSLRTRTDCGEGTIRELDSFIIGKRNVPAWSY